MTVFQFGRKNLFRLRLVNLRSVRYCSKPCFPTLKSAKPSALKRGTGGRCSFNGIVATLFGSSGFLGRYVCNKLGKSGTQMILPYRGDMYEMRFLKVCGDLGQIIFQPFHLLDDKSIRQACKYSNVVINMIGREWETKNFTFDCVHAEGPQKIARIAKECGVQTFIHVSALNANPDPEEYMIPGGSNFLKSKHLGEELVRKEFPEAIIFRPSDIYGQEDRFLKYYCSVWRHMGKWVPLYQKGEKTEKQPVYVQDVADGIVAACMNKNARGKIYQAVGPTRYLLSELVDWFHRIMNKTESWGYRRYSLEKDPLFKMIVTYLPYCTLGWPFGNLHWEKIEKECHSDKVAGDLPTLKDLGVKLTHMEDQVPWELRLYKLHSAQELEIREFEPPIPPRPISSK
ncbi:NADH dehydrogenase [ubiquinone] 1 alpha subcomplex subunit 9, mitochondrial [Halyomorpha halys]|uniref:NADH dehydrogenase [ubiquinone] 1 alpha subcomplex subunit 9, mitochondrial n=1 Tax=Halyomorpha halys TaxID=286706 RepID=UPI0006D501C0|nr:NADH dehydrogenase [ubiquinone] 1 alpha subcomplex subunit 9, mitochondrial [Halyomorpha halys]